jgi:hypothetical protein
MNNQTDTRSAGQCACTWPVAEIFKCFRIAISPTKLLPALLTVIALFLAGVVIDVLGVGNKVVPGEFDKYVEVGGAQAFETWRTDQTSEQAVVSGLTRFLERTVRLGFEESSAIAERDDRWSKAHEAINRHYGDLIAQATARLDGDVADRAQKKYRNLRAQALDDFREMRPQGVFMTTLRIKLDAFQEMVEGLINPATLTDPARTLGPPLAALATLPCWLWDVHPWFLVVWLIVFAALWALLGGAISRSTMVEVATGHQMGFAPAVSYAARHWWSYLAAPLMPMILLGAGWLALAVSGLVMFNVPVLNILGGLLFFLALLVGFGLALLVIFWAFGMHLMYPALSAEGSDAFDAVARSFSYLSSRPWRFIGYSAVALIYGAITYLFVGAVVYLTLYITQAATSAWAGSFGEMMPQPELGALCYWPQFDRIDSTTGDVAAVFVAVFVNAAVAVVAAYAISYYFAATSQIYLLLRRSCDGVETAQVYIEPQDSYPEPPQDKVEAATGDADQE